MLRRSARFLVLAVLLGCTASETTEDLGPISEPTTVYYDHAVATAEWIRSTLPLEGDGVWPENALAPGEPGPGLGTGTAGTTLFFLELYRVDGDKKWLREVRRGADHLVATLPGFLESSPGALEDASASSLYNGWPGAGFVLHRVAVALADSIYLYSSHQVVDRLLESLEASDTPGAWNDRFDVLNGSAGTALFLLYAEREMAREDVRPATQAVGAAVLGSALRKEGGLTWPMGPGREEILPGFSHGASGIGFLLATLARDHEDELFEVAATNTLRYLEAISLVDSTSGGYRIPYGFGNESWEGRSDIGWAHGVAGTARFLFRMAELTGDPQWTERLDASAVTLREDSGLPGDPAPGFGEAPFKPDRRFGSASAAAFLLDLYELFGDEENLAVARLIAEDLLARGTLDDTGLRFEFPQYSFFPDPGAPAAYTGYFYGAAGYGLLFLQLDAGLRNEIWPLEFPDDSM